MMELGSATDLSCSKNVSKWNATHSLGAAATYGFDRLDLRQRCSRSNHVGCHRRKWNTLVRVSLLSLILFLHHRKFHFLFCRLIDIIKVDQIAEGLLHFTLWLAVCFIRSESKRCIHTEMRLTHRRVCWCCRGVTVRSLEVGLWNRSPWRWWRTAGSIGVHNL